MTYSPSIVRATDPASIETAVKMPSGILPRCDERGCTFVMRSLGGYHVLEHRDRDGQRRGLGITDAEIADVTYDIWADIKPFYESLHGGDDRVHCVRMVVSSANPSLTIENRGPA